MKVSMMIIIINIQSTKITNHSTNLLDWYGSHTLKSFVTCPQAGNLTNGDANGYGILALKEDQEFDNLLPVFRDDVTATMTNIPCIHDNPIIRLF